MDNPNFPSLESLSLLTLHRYRSERGHHATKSGAIRERPDTLGLGLTMTAGKQPGRALHVAVVLWYRAGMGGGNAVRLTASARTEIGLKPDAASRGLAALEKAGLVSVVRHAGRIPVVTLLDVPDGLCDIADSGAEMDE